MVMKNKILLIGVFVVFLAVLYLNRSYAYIYQTIGGANLRLPNQENIYHLGVAESSDQNMLEKKTLTYVALGDSLSAGAGTDSDEQSFPYLLANKIGRESDSPIDLLNLSVPGYKSSDLLGEYLDQAFAAKPDFVTILVGVNDIHNQISVEDFISNYEKILSRLEKNSNSQINIINIPFIGAKTLILPPYDLYFQKKTEKFNKALAVLAAKHDVKIIDLYSFSYRQLREPGDHYSRDLFHPSAAGYSVWADFIYENLNK